MLVIFGLLKTPVFSEVWLDFFMKDKIKNSTTSTDLKKVLMWLQKNNKLYKEFFSNFETIIGHFEPLSSSSSFASVPSFTKDLKIAKGDQLSVADLEKQEGLLFPADKFISPVEPTNIHDVQIGEEV